MSKFIAARLVTAKSFHRQEGGVLNKHVFLVYFCSPPLSDTHIVLVVAVVAFWGKKVETC